MRPRFSLHLSVLAALAALTLVLAGCGGGGGASGTSVAGSSGNSAGQAGSLTLIAVGAQQEVRITSADAAAPGGLPLARMRNAVIAGERIMLHSDSAAELLIDKSVFHPGTRISILDQQGKFVASHDYGMTLAEGYVGEWAMLPAPDGVVMLQTGAGAKMHRFDANGARTSAAEGRNLYVAQPVDSPLPTVVAGAAAVDGNGFWYATTLVERPIPGSEKGAIYSLMLCKFDFDGNELTPPFKLTASIKFLQPHIAASAGAVLVSWLDAGAPMQAYWPYGYGRPLVRSVNGTGGGSPDLLPLPMASAGHVGLVWNFKQGLTSNLLGVAFDGTGSAILPSGRTDMTQEILSSGWSGARRDRVSFDARSGSDGTLMIADLVKGAANTADPVGDMLLLADYKFGSGAVSAGTANVQRVRREPSAPSLGNAPILRQLMFADHAVLLVGDENHLESAIVTRR